MTSVFVYSALGILVVLMLALLLREIEEARAAPTEVDADCAKGLWEGPALRVAERIFDAADYHWLRNELGSPALAQALRQNRKLLALRWLAAVRKSFDEMVRTPEATTRGMKPNGGPGSWELLRLTLRFYLFLSYAFLVVRFLGPYHRLIPSFGWTRRLWDALPRADRYDASDVFRVH